MVGVVETEAPHGLDVLRRQGGQQHADVGDVVRHVVPAEYVARDDAGLPRLGDVGDAAGQDRIAVVRLAVAREEADESLGRASVSRDDRRGVDIRLTENDAITEGGYYCS